MISNYVALHLYLGCMTQKNHSVHDETSGKDMRGTFSVFVRNVDLIFHIVTLTRT